MKVNKRGSKSLLEDNPELAKEFDVEKNGITPDRVSYAEKISRHWVCSKCGYSFESPVYKRNRLKRGCHCCTNRVCVPEINSLKAKRPDLVEEWHQIKNIPLTSETVVYGSALKVWWKCKTCNYEWETNIFKRSKYNQNCLLCNKGKNNSFPEQSIFYYLKKIFKNTENEVKLNGGYHVDILNEEYKIAIEYDGYNWHKDRRYEDSRKNYLLRNYLFIRVREEGLESIEDYGCINLFVVARNDSSMDNVINEIFDIIKVRGNFNFINPIIDICKDRPNIRSMIKRSITENSFVKKRPDLLQEWDYESNVNLDPYTLSDSSNEKVAWRCKRYGHKFNAVINNRTRGKGTNCPYCTNRKVLQGFNDLATTEPLIAREWLNNLSDLSPSDVVYGSTEEVNWKCSDCEELFICSVNSRTAYSTGRGCRKCSKKFVLVGQLIFDEEVLGLRLFYGKRFLDVRLNVLKTKGFNLKFTAAPIIYIKPYNDRCITHIEYIESIRVMEVKENDPKFFKRFEVYLTKHNGHIPIRTMESILKESNLNNTKNIQLGGINK